MWKWGFQEHSEFDQSRGGGGEFRHFKGTPPWKGQCLVVDQKLSRISGGSHWTKKKVALAEAAAPPGIALAGFGQAAVHGGGGIPKIKP